MPVPLHAHKSGIRTDRGDHARSCSRPSDLRARRQCRHGQRAGPQPVSQARRDRSGRGVQGSVELAAARRSAVEPLPVAPRQIPYHAGMTYFELDRSNAYWQRSAALGSARSSASRATGPSSRSNAGRSGTEPCAKDDPFGLYARSDRTVVIRPQPGGRRRRAVRTASRRRPSDRGRRRWSCRTGSGAIHCWRRPCRS